MQTTKQKYQAQTFIEYVLMISVVTAILLSLSTLVKRGVQGMVKVVADQVGFQSNAEQDKDGGFLVSMDMDIQTEQAKRVTDRVGNITYNFEVDRQRIEKTIYTNLGLTEEY